MSNYLDGESIIVTGAAGGFGQLISEKAAAMGAKITCLDINGEALQETVNAIKSAGGSAIGVVSDVTKLADMKAAASQAVDAFGRIDVMINNAGVMPLAMYADHEIAADKWDMCIDINIKGVLNGTIAVYDQMIAQGSGHVINLSSIYGNFPVIGAAVYGATKSAVNYMSESLRVEARGKIKVTTIKPTGVPGTGLGHGVVNPDAMVGLLGQNMASFMETVGAFTEGNLPPENLDSENMDYRILDPEHIASQVIYVMNQPQGVSISDVTVRAAGDHYIL